MSRLGRAKMDKSNQRRTRRKYICSSRHRSSCTCRHLQTLPGIGNHRRPDIGWIRWSHADFGTSALTCAARIVTVRPIGASAISLCDWTCQRLPRVWEARLGWRTRSTLCGRRPYYGSITPPWTDMSWNSGPACTPDQERPESAGRTAIGQTYCYVVSSIC